MKASPALAPTERHGKYWYPLGSHPIGRVLKFETFLKHLEEIPPGGSVLDYGSGDRPYEEILLKKFDRYTAADHPAANLKHARKPDVLINDDNLPVTDATMDCVILTEVLEHIYDPKKALREIHRVLKTGGHVIGSVPFVIGEHESPYDFHRYTSFCLSRMFQETGFNVIHLEYVGDAVGSAVSIISGCLALIPKALNSFHLRPVAIVVGRMLRLPDYLYYWAKPWLRFDKVERLRTTPLGFAFLLTKK